MRQPTLRPVLSLPKVYLYRDPIDFRKSHRGLSALVELELGHNLFNGELYVFTNKQRNKICLLKLLNIEFKMIGGVVAAHYTDYHRSPVLLNRCVT